MLIAEVLEDGTILNTKRYTTGKLDKEEIIQILIRGVKEYEQEIGWQGKTRPKQMGVGINGVIDPAAGVWKKLGEHDVEVKLRERLTEEFDLCCYIDNDVKGTVMAENRYGAGKGCRDMIYINVGTGLAAGMITSGKLIRGSDGFAGEVGFMNFTSGMGERVELLSSGMGIRYQAKELLAEYPDSMLSDSVCTGVTGQELFEKAKLGDPMSNCILNRLIQMIGLMISNLTCVLSPEIVVLGGGLITNENMLEKIRAAVLPKAKQHLEKGIVLTNLAPDYAGLMGAAAVGHGCQREYS